MDAHHDRIAAANIAAMDRRDDRYRAMASVPNCPYCGQDDGMALYDAEWVLWLLDKQQPEEYDAAPFYRVRTRDYKLSAPCGTCNPQRIIPDEYRELTWQQARLWALRQARLERRATAARKVQVAFVPDYYVGPDNVKVPYAMKGEQS